MHESVHFDAWLVNRLQSDTGVGGLFEIGSGGARVLGVFSEKIPNGQTLPAIRFTDLSPSDTNGASGQRILVRGLYLVAVVGKTADYGDLVAAADRLDDRLQRSSGLLSPVWVLSVVRQSPFKLAEVDGDVQYRHLGGIYQIDGHKE